MELDPFLRKRGGNEAAAKAKGLQYEIVKHLRLSRLFH
jgi:hypothetical protein